MRPALWLLSQALYIPQHALESLLECRFLVSRRPINENPGSSKVGRILTWCTPALKGLLGEAFRHCLEGVHICCGPWSRVGESRLVLGGVCSPGHSWLRSWAVEMEPRSESSPGTFLPTVCCPHSIIEQRAIRSQFGATF